MSTWTAFLTIKRWSVLRCASGSVLHPLIILFRASLLEEVRPRISLWANFGQPCEWEPSEANPTSMANDLVIGQMTEKGNVPSGRSKHPLNLLSDIWTCMGFACPSDKTSGLPIVRNIFSSQFHETLNLKLKYLNKVYTCSDSSFQTNWVALSTSQIKSGKIYKFTRISRLLLSHSIHSSQPFSLLSWVVLLSTFLDSPSIHLLG